MLALVERIRRAFKKWRGQQKKADDGWRSLGPDWLGGFERREPSASELLDGYQDTAFYCANLNARAVAKTPLRLFVRTAPGQPTARWLTKPMGKTALARMRREADRSLAPNEMVDEVLTHPLSICCGRRHDAACRCFRGSICSNKRNSPKSSVALLAGGLNDSAFPRRFGCCRH